MNRTRWLVLMAAALVVAACGERNPAPRNPRDARLDALEQGVAWRRDRPVEAARLLAAAGPAAELERIRFQIWFEALQRGDLGTDAWIEFLRQHPPRELADQARLLLAARLADAGEAVDAERMLAGVSPMSAVEADEVRLKHLSGEEGLGAAVRLAVRAPGVLRTLRPDLEDLVLAVLTPEQWLERARSWRRADQARIAVDELRRRRFAGDLERTRRLEVALAEEARGRTSAALAVLPRLGLSTGDEALIHARAARGRGWSGWPGARGRQAFAECVTAARRARTAAETTGQRMESLELELECATEWGRLDMALESWRQLARGGWEGARKGWLGRRLGVGLARRDGWSAEVWALASSLPDHARCLTYWAAQGEAESLQTLAEFSSPDLYALWAMEDGKLAPAQSPRRSRPGMKSARPPETVRWLMERDLVELASREWRRAAEVRGAAPDEALAAAMFERHRGRPDLAVRWLLAGYDQLGGVFTTEAPDAAVRLYLPLDWEQEIQAAAREAGLDPWLLAGLARQESLFIASARSPAGAVGLVQLLPGTARGHAVALGLGRAPDLTDPATNLRLGARELRALMDDFGALELALAAYNAGPTRVRRWQRTWRNPRELTENIPIPETYSYVRRVRFLAEAYHRVWFDKGGNDATD